MSDDWRTNKNFDLGRTEIKIVLIGDADVGKTTAINAFVDD